MNDPKVQPDFKDEGVIFRLDPDLTLHRMIEKVTIPNGMGFTVDGKIMYFTNTPTGKAFRFKYDRKSGDISDREVFYHPEGDGGPEGLAIDSTGCLWIAVSDGGKVLKVLPEAKLLGEISLPTRMIKCPAFAGEDLFITFAEEEELEKYPNSVKYRGSLFKVHVRIGASPLHKFRNQ